MAAFLCRFIVLFVLCSIIRGFRCMFLLWSCICSLFAFLNPLLNKSEALQDDISKIVNIVRWSAASCCFFLFTKCFISWRQVGVPLCLYCDRCEKHCCRSLFVLSNVVFLDCRHL